MSNLPIWLQALIGTMLGIIAMKLLLMILKPVYRFVNNIIYSIGYHRRMKKMVANNPNQAKAIIEALGSRGLYIQEELQELLDKRDNK